MKFVTFERNGSCAPGVILEQGQVLDIKTASAAAGGEPFGGMLDVIAAGAAGLELIRNWIRNPPDGCLVKMGDVRLKAPFPLLNMIRDFANYELHVRQAIAASLKVRARATPDPDATLAKFYEDGLHIIPKIWFEQPL